MKKSLDPQWEILHSEREWGQYPTEHVIRFVARNFYKVTDRSAIKILDYGAGGGGHTWYLSREGFDVYAFDGAPSAVKRIQERLRREGLKADIQLSDALSTPYSENFFDAVVDNFCVTMNTADNVRSMYHEIYRVLKHGGKMLSGLFGKQTKGYQTGTMIDANTWDKIDNAYLHDVGKIYFTNNAEITNLLSEAGFIDISIDTIFYTDDGVNIEQIIAKAKKPAL